MSNSVEVVHFYNIIYRSITIITMKVTEQLDLRLGIKNLSQLNQ